MPVIASELINQLKSAAKSSEGYSKNGIILGIHCPAEEGTVCVSAVESSKQLPIGFTVAGAYCLDPQADLSQIKPAVKSKGKKKVPSILLHVNSDSEVVAYLQQPDGSLVDDEIEQLSAAYVFKGLFVISIAGSVSITFQNKDSASDSIKEWEKSANHLKFSLESSEFVLQCNGKDEVTDLYGYVNDAESQALEDVPAPEKLKKQQRDKIKNKRIEAKAPLSFQIVDGAIGDAPDKGDHSFGQALDIPIQLSFYVNGDLSTNELHKLMVKAIKDQLSLVSDFVQGKCKEDTFPHPKVYQFFPRPAAHHLINVVYPATASDKQLVEQRKQIHLTNLLPLDRPLVTKLNKLIIGKVAASGHLINPHEGLDSGVKSPNIQALVQGSYLYHHYMQDSYDDNGWGCAYRSLQTIASWFNLQGYISNSYPSHKEIQQALVDCGDKQANFVGTRRWIGSQEVGFVLNQLYGITSKVMFVPSGGDLANKGRELVQHFTTQGTPIMIGGGVLAHTILGVDLNEKTGLIKFLILDPHYTGSEDLQTVQKKGWCGWKAASFWEKTSFYNLCMPQRPIQF